MYLKTHSLILVLLFFISSSCYSQIKIGLRGGGNVSIISFANLPDRSEKYGFHIGLITEVSAIPGFLSIQPEVSFSTKGTDYSYLGERKTISMNSMDLLLPISFKFNSISLQVGPFVSFLIDKPIFTNTSNNAIILNGFSKFDSGLSTGICYSFSNFFLGVRYNQGLINVSNDEIIAAIGKGRNAVGQVSLGFWF